MLSTCDPGRVWLHRPLQDVQASSICPWPSSPLATLDGGADSAFHLMFGIVNASVRNDAAPPAIGFRPYSPRLNTTRQPWPSSRTILGFELAFRDPNYQPVFLRQDFLPSLENKLRLGLCESRRSPASIPPRRQAGKIGVKRGQPAPCSL